jgi:hypothetical protein
MHGNTEPGDAVHSRGAEPEKMLTMNFDATTWQEARRGLETAVALHRDDPNVTLIDLGYRLRTSL